MKDRPVLFVAIILTLIVELGFMFMVFTAIGAQRLPYQIGRLLVQLFVIAFIFDKSKIALFLLVAYHVFSGINNLYAINTNGIFSIGLGIFHLTIALIIYFHDWIENNMGIDRKNEQ